MPRTFDAMLKRSNVPLSTLHYRAHGRRSIEEKAQSQQYLTPCEEKAVVEFMLQMDDLGQPVRIKYLSQLAFSITRRRPTADRPSKPPTDMPKPPAELTVPVPNASGVEVSSCPQCEILQTPVTSEGLTLLNNLIKQDADADDEVSKQRRERHLQKLANAAQTSFAKNALLQDRTRFLIKINNESKVRRSTTSVVLGKAKVMSYEDLEEARAKRAEKEAAKEAKGKGKRGRKPKSAVSKAEEASADKGNRGSARVLRQKQIRQSQRPRRRG